MWACTPVCGTAGVHAPVYQVGMSSCVWNCRCACTCVSGGHVLLCVELQVSMHLCIRWACTPVCGTAGVHAPVYQVACTTVCGTAGVHAPVYQVGMSSCVWNCRCACTCVSGGHVLLCVELQVCMHLCIRWACTPVCGTAGVHAPVYQVDMYSCVWNCRCACTCVSGGHVLLCVELQVCMHLCIRWACTPVCGTAGVHAPVYQVGMYSCVWNCRCACTCASGGHALLCVELQVSMRLYIRWACTPVCGTAGEHAPVYQVGMSSCVWNCRCAWTCISVFLDTSYTVYVCTRVLVFMQECMHFYIRSLLVHWLYIHIHLPYVHVHRY
ncbi:keratin-associated protein 10-9-like isoform X6 [Apodemus sylvaticus]|uniref:keratin-associated protein 10-9-like isoform X6 n=1 Tax=Apodemus sylvaticus TaxID=10129 RepID=UPI002243CE76|nr:keratin-associated protein 10-9-like isoform X6 [Apodemus sylvaticus]